MSPLPRPCRAETAYGSPSPRLHILAASASVRGSSTLLTARTTGFWLRRSTRTTASSSSITPTVASTTNNTASARSMAISACPAIWAAIPVASDAQPPVSTTTNWRPFHSAS